MANFLSCKIILRKKVWSCSEFESCFLYLWNEKFDIKPLSKPIISNSGESLKQKYPLATAFKKDQSEKVIESISNKGIVAGILEDIYENICFDSNDSNISGTLNRSVQEYNDLHNHYTNLTKEKNLSYIKRNISPIDDSVQSIPGDSGIKAANQIGEYDLSSFPNLRPIHFNNFPSEATNFNADIGSKIAKNLPQISGVATENISRFLELVKRCNGPPISIINTVDDVPPPTDFVFINSSIYASDVTKPHEFDVNSCWCESKLLDEHSYCVSIGNKSLTLHEFKESEYFNSNYIQEFRKRFSGPEFDSRLRSLCATSVGNENNENNEVVCSHNRGAGNPYNTKGLLILPKGEAIYECNWSCECGPLCFNRVVQRGPAVSLQIFRTKHKGWGVRTLQPLQKGQFIAEYVGEVITNAEADRRGKINDKMGSTYLFDLDFETSKNKIIDFAIDAGNYGNISHFLNHSCVPNLEIRAVYTNHWNKKQHQLAFFTTERIPAGTELTFDYNPSSPFPGDPDWKESQPKKKKPKKSKKNNLKSPSDYIRLENSKKFITEDQPIEEFHPYQDTYKCYCGAPKCRGVVFK
ncbi:Histone-lysine N-methyltransferase SUV39H2 [Smittium mucronatum]|uniref:Histone-lysine N-methyltransferase SUV39H2 n=1 Tax=Smittium mucronatum TaxID=133383 RepID=A0A1R0GY96_9FUNG|nr:Histone-lysine N-methyltransferase SUV39H2 [Smittium mucronatum]